MRILMIAPQPFFEPRGTPFSEYHRIRALVDLGHTVDLVTYPFGQDVTLPGLRVIRCARPPLLDGVRVGPSLAKVPLDLVLTVTAIRQVFRSRYDAVHSHEEGVVIGVALARALGIPHLYDMHSSLPQQLSNFGFSQSRLLGGLFRWIERLAIRRSRVVVVICPHLEDVVRGVDPAARTVLIENAPGAGDTAGTASGRQGREELGLAPSTPMVLYTGTFEAYQGLDLLFAAARRVVEQEPATRFVLVGGRPDQIEIARGQARAAGVEDATIFTGQRPPEDIPSFLEAATLLVSPRSTGWNTPLKIYQYLRSGKPIVATRLLTHTQVLDDKTAILTGTSAEEFAEGVLLAIRDPERGRRVGEQAKRLADTKYTYESYLERTREACAVLSGTSEAQVAGGVA